MYDHLQGARDREPPEDGHTYGPKQVGATSLKCF
jgi:hypothetical protein